MFLLHDSFFVFALRSFSLLLGGQESLPVVTAFVALKILLNEHVNLIVHKYSPLVLDTLVQLKRVLLIDLGSDYLTKLA